MNEKIKQLKRLEASLAEQINLLWLQRQQIASEMVALQRDCYHRYHAKCTEDRYEAITCLTCGNCGETITIHEPRGENPTSTHVTRGLGEVAE